MKTTLYFIRHAEPNRKNPARRKPGESDYVDATFPLTDKGLADRALVNHFLRDKKIDIVLSSPFKRSYDTVAMFAEEIGLTVEVIEDFRERRITHEHVWVEDFRAYSENQWADFTYKLEDGESLGEVQARNVAALQGVLKQYAGKNIAVGTHGTALSTLLHHYDPTYSLTDFMDMADRMPWAVKMIFDGEKHLSTEKIDLFAQLPPASESPVNTQNNAIDNKNVITQVYPYNTFTEYHYTVIFARQAKGDKWQWLYVRHKNRFTFECPGGRIEPGETPIRGAIRELKEETGAVNFVINPAFDYTVHRPEAYGIGQVFLADIEDLTLFTFEYEMAEIKAFDDLPETMTYPGILPILYEAMQNWLAKNTPNEYRDLLDANRKPLGITHRRGTPQAPGTYVTVVRAWVMNDKNEILITQRAYTKLGGPGKWEIPSGSVSAGEESRTAALRELKEESGITVPPESGSMLRSYRDGGAFWDNWLFYHNFNVKDVVLQEGETIAAKAASVEEIKTLVKAGNFITGVDEELSLIERLDTDAE